VGTNTFLLRATDGGSPALSDTRLFEIVATPSLQITSIAVSNEIVSLHWSAMASRSYSIQFKDSLSEPDWALLTTNIVATNNSASMSDPIGTNTQRIYRIVLEP
jgi:hypothetical protein